MKITVSQLRKIIREEVEKSMGTTTFECRLCGKMIQGEASPEGPKKAGWASLKGIDGPNSVCPECAEMVKKDRSMLDDFREEYPNVRLEGSSLIWDPEDPQDVHDAFLRWRSYKGEVPLERLAYELGVEPDQINWNGTGLRVINGMVSELL